MKILTSALFASPEKFHQLRRLVVIFLHKLIIFRTDVLPGQHAEGDAEQAVSGHQKRPGHNCEAGRPPGQFRR